MAKVDNYLQVIRVSDCYVYAVLAGASLSRQMGVSACSRGDSIQCTLLTLDTIAPASHMLLAFPRSLLCQHSGISEAPLSCGGGWKYADLHTSGRCFTIL